VLGAELNDATPPIFHGFLPLTGLPVERKQSRGVAGRERCSDEFHRKHRPAYEVREDLRTHHGFNMPPSQGVTSFLRDGRVWWCCVVSVLRLSPRCLASPSRALVSFCSWKGGGFP